MVFQGGFSLIFPVQEEPVTPDSMQRFDVEGIALFPFGTSPQIHGVGGGRRMSSSME